MVSTQMPRPLGGEFHFQLFDIQIADGVAVDALLAIDCPLFDSQPQLAQRVPVAPGAVEVIHPQVHGAPDQPDGFFIADRAKVIAEPLGPEGNHRDGEFGFSPAPPRAYCSVPGSRNELQHLVKPFVSGPIFVNQSTPMAKIRSPTTAASSHPLFSGRGVSDSQQSLAIS